IVWSKESPVTQPQVELSATPGLNPPLLGWYPDLWLTNTSKSFPAEASNGFSAPRWLAYLGSYTPSAPVKAVSAVRLPTRAAQRRSIWVLSTGTGQPPFR